MLNWKTESYSATDWQQREESIHTQKLQHNPGSFKFLNFAKQACADHAPLLLPLKWIQIGGKVENRLFSLPMMSSFDVSVSGERIKQKQKKIHRNKRHEFHAQSTRTELINNASVKCVRAAAERGAC